MKRSAILAALSLGACTSQPRSAGPPADASSAAQSTAAAASARVVDAARAPRRPGGVRCGVVWDPAAGAIADGRVVFDGDRVAALGGAADVPAAADELDLRPLFCMPGLVDAHTHLTSYAHASLADSTERRRSEAARNARLTLEAGVTWVRDLGGDAGVDLWLRERIAAGALPGPRMQCAGAQIGASGAVGGPAAARAAVDQQVERGADVIKLFATGGAEEPLPRLTGAEMAAAVAQAHAHHRTVAVHAFGEPGVAASLAAGVDSIEHAAGATVAQARAMAARGTVLVPTLYILRYYVEDAASLGLAPSEVAGLKSVIDGPLARFEARLPALLATGVRVAMGSDSFMALHGRNARELTYLVRAGMSPEQAMRAATATSAELIGHAREAGTLRAGARADVIAMRADPRRDVAEVERVVVVIEGGGIVRDGRTTAPGSSPAP